MHDWVYAYDWNDINQGKGCVQWTKAYGTQVYQLKADHLCPAPNNQPFLLDSQKEYPGGSDQALFKLQACSDHSFLQHI